MSIIDVFLLQTMCFNFEFKKNIISVHVEVCGLTMGQNLMSELESHEDLGTSTTQPQPKSNISISYFNIG